MTSDGAAGRRWWLTLAAVSVVALVVRVVYVLVVASRTELRADATWYLLQAGIIGSGEGYLDPEAYFGRGEALATANFPPLWPALLAVFEWAGVGGEQAYRLVGAVVGTGTVALTGLVGRRVVGRRGGLVAAAVVACSPLMIAADGSLMAESLYGLLVMATVLTAYQARRHPTVGWMAAVGLVGGLAVLARSDGIFVIPLVVLAAAVPATGLSAGRRTALAGAGLAVVVVVVAPWSIRNTVRLDAPVALTSNAGSVLEGANCPTTYSGELLGGWDPACLTETRRVGLTEAEWADAGQAKGFEYARDHAERVPLVVAARVARTLGLWDPVESSRLEAIENRHERWQLAGWLYGVVSLALGVAGAVVLIRRKADLWPLAAVVVGVAASVVVAWGNQRFRLAAEPVIAIAAAAAITRVLTRWSQSARTSATGEPSRLR